MNLGMLTQMNNDNKVYVLLRSIDLFTVWNLAASAIGISVLAGKKGAQPYVWVFGIWLVIILFSTFVLGGMFA